jgi:hypothetical protein
MSAFHFDNSRIAVAGEEPQTDLLAGESAEGGLSGRNELHSVRHLWDSSDALLMAKPCRRVCWDERVDVVSQD